MDFESLSGLPSDIQVKVLLAVLESNAVDNYRIGQLLNDTGSDVALRYLEDHEHTSERIKERILTLFSQR